MKTIIALLLMATSAFAGTVNLQWGPSSGASGYYVYTDDVKGPAVTGTTASIKVVNGAHSFYVTAFNDRGESPKSNTVTTPPLATSPASFATVVKNNTATFSWNPVAGAEEYRLYLNGVSVKATSPFQATIPDGAVSAYVTAYNAWGESGPSALIDILPLPTAPGSTVVVTVEIQ